MPNCLHPFPSHQRRRRFAQVPNSAAHLYMIGDGALKAQVEHYVSKKGLREHVTCTGALNAEALHRHYQIGSVLIMPSRNEGLSISLLEAMSHGIVPIASPVGAQQEALESAGFLEGSIDSMVVRLSALYHMPAAEMRLLRQRSIEAIGSKFSSSSFEASWNKSIHAPVRGRQVAPSNADRGPFSAMRARGRRRMFAKHTPSRLSQFLPQRNASSLQLELQDVCMDAQVHEGYHSFAQVMNQLLVNAKKMLDYNIMHSSGVQEVETA